MRSIRLQTILTTFAVIISLTGLLTACSGQTAAEADNRKTPTAQTGKRESIFGGKATITLPKGFRIASNEDIEKRAKSGSAPSELFVGPVEGRSIETEALIGLETYEGTLADMKGFNERMHKSYSSWERSEIFKVNGREWYVFEWKKPEPSSDLENLVAPPTVDENGKVVESEKPDDRLWHYINYFTVIDGIAHRISFNALRDDMPNAKKDFQASFDSIEFKK